MILEIGKLYITRKSTLLFDAEYKVVGVEEGCVLLLVDMRYNTVEKMLVLSFVADNKSLKACNHEVCDNIPKYFEEFGTEKT